MFVQSDICLSDVCRSDVCLSDVCRSDACPSTLNSLAMLNLFNLGANLILSNHSETTTYLTNYDNCTNNCKLRQFKDNSIQSVHLGK